MALGNSNQIIVGAARLFVSKGTGGKGALKYSQGSGSAAVYNFSGSGSVSGIPAFASGTRFADTMEAATDYNNVGYTMNGLELQFQPDFGEVQVDQLQVKQIPSLLEAFVGWDTNNKYEINNANGQKVFNLLNIKIIKK